MASKFLCQDPSNSKNSQVFSKFDEIDPHHSFFMNDFNLNDYRHQISCNGKVNFGDQAFNEERNRLEEQQIFQQNSSSPTKTPEPIYYQSEPDQYLGSIEQNNFENERKTDLNLTPRTPKKKDRKDKKNTGDQQSSNDNSLKQKKKNLHPTKNLMHWLWTKAVNYIDRKGKLRNSQKWQQIKQKKGSMDKFNQLFNMNEVYYEIGEMFDQNYLRRKVMESSIPLDRKIKYTEKITTLYIGYINRHIPCIN